MTRIRMSRMTYKKLKRFGILLSITAFLVLIVFPVCVHHSTSIQLYFIFRHKSLQELFIRGEAIDYDSPEKYGLPGTLNFYQQVDSDIFVGVWHILPESLMYLAPPISSNRRNAWFEESLGRGKPIFLYLHGNRYTRSKDYRIALYRVLRSLDYHVITMDYRGYAESDAEPSEESLVADAKAVYEHVIKFAGNTPVYVYGHSLGTGVACRLVADVCEKHNCPTALFLQSPFNNLSSAIRVSKLGKRLEFLPHFEWAIITPLERKNITFENDRHIAKIPIHIIILHSRDDTVIPYHLGEQLYKTALSSRPKYAAPIILNDLDGKHGLNHNEIHLWERLPVAIEKFVRETRMEKKKEDEQDSI